MKRFFSLLLCLTVCALLFTACDAERMSSLKDVTRPYAGVFECEKISLGGEDLTEKFERLTLTLKENGEYALSYRTVEGNEGGYGGGYTVDAEKHTITLTAGKEKRAFTFPYEKGRILIDQNLGGTLLHAEFCPPS